MLIALAFAHFSSKLLLKEQMIIPVKKTTLNNAGHIDAELIDFKRNLPNWLLIVSWRSFPPKFPVKLADFSKNLPLKILRNRTIFRRILTLLERKSCEIGWFFREFWLFSREINRFFREFAPENPAKFCFFFPRNIRSPAYRRYTEGVSKMVQLYIM